MLPAVGVYVTRRRPARRREIAAVSGDKLSIEPKAIEDKRGRCSAHCHHQRGEASYLPSILAGSQAKRPDHRRPAELMRGSENIRSSRSSALAPRALFAGIGKIN